MRSTKSGEIGSKCRTRNTSLKWPGSANLEISVVWITCGQWRGTANLDGEALDLISSSLSPDSGFSLDGVQALASNKGNACEGVKTLGMGFVLEPEEALQLMEKNPKNSEVIRPFINGDDLNSRPDQSPSRYVIDFFDWPEKKAMAYPDCWEIIDARVKPERQRLKEDGSFVLRKPLPQRYWQFGDSRFRFRNATLGLSQIIVAVQTSKYIAPCLQPNDRIFSQALVMIASDDPAILSVVNSSVHREWIAANCSSLKKDIRYLVSDGFNTFPFAIVTDACREAGRSLTDIRSAYMASEQVGLTATYNRIHDPDFVGGNIEKLRDTLVRVDQATLEAYGWEDIELNYGFHEVEYLTESERLRFTISEPARMEILRRLSRLNAQRYNEEKKASRSTKATRSSTSLRASSTRESNQGELSLVEAAPKGVATPSDTICAANKILSHLKSRRSWLSKSDILAYVDIPDGQWNAAINDLLARGTVERQGDRRSARYRISESD